MSAPAPVAPRRVQRQRIKGEKGMPEGAVYIGRGSLWGNPFRVGDHYASRTWAHDRPEPRGDRSEPGTYHREGITFGPWVETIGVVRDGAHAVELFRAHIAYEDIAWNPELIRERLAGRDLACWCKPGSPCHGDVLLAVANPAPAVPSLRDRAADPAVVARVAARPGPLVDRGAAERQARDVIATVLDALEVAP